MKKNKTAELFLVLLILTVMSVGVFILQNGMEKLQNVKQQSVYVPETRDLYNNYGLKNDQSLSKTKILETQDQVIYTDRIFKINQISEDQISYAADIMKALQEKSGKDAYIMPIPERAVFESGYENEKEKYNNFTEKLESSFADPSVVLNPLSELEKHQSEYLYFRTKNSWTMRGAFYGAQVIFGELGYDKDNIFILSSGDVLELDNNGAAVTGKVPVGTVLVDGLGVGDVGNVVLRDRQHLAEDGILIVVMSLDGSTGELLAGPDIVSRGFVYVKESDALMDEAHKVIEKAVISCLKKNVTDWGKIKGTIKDTLGEFVWKKTKRRPMILPIIMEIE